MIGVATTTYLILRYDRRSARYYAITGSGTDYPDGFDEKADEDKRKETKEDFDSWRPRIEIGQALCFGLTVLAFSVLVVIH